MKVIDYFHITAVAENGTTVTWRRVDNFKSDDNGTVLRDEDGTVLGLIPVKGWLVQVSPRVDKKS